MSTTKKSKSLTNHPLLDLVAKIDKKFVEDLPPVEAIPTDPEDFYNWWWQTYGKGCEECLLALTRNKVVKADGNTKASIMIVGEGPGFLEDLAALPMVGPMELRGSHCSLCSKVKDCYSQRLLGKPFSSGMPPKKVTCNPDYKTTKQLPSTFYIRSAGAIVDGILINKWKFSYPRHNWIVQYNANHPNEPWTHDSPWFITNVVLCRTTDITGIKDKTPDSLPRSKCKRWLAFQWAAVQPKLIIAVGRVALATLMGSEEGSKSIVPNTIVQTKFGPVLFQNHPASMMRENSKTLKAYGFAKFATTLEKALEYVGLPI